MTTLQDSEDKDDLATETVSDESDTGQIQEKVYWSEMIMAVFYKSPEARKLGELLFAMKEMYRKSNEAAIQAEASAQQNTMLRHCLHAVLATFIVMSGVLVGVFYMVGWTNVGLSFLGPIITGIVGLIVVLLIGRKPNQN